MHLRDTKHTCRANLCGSCAHFTGSSEGAHTTRYVRTRMHTQIVNAGKPAQRCDHKNQHTYILSFAKFAGSLTAVNKF